MKIVITGPESTGKSTVAEQLAAHYNTKWVPEYAREYIKGLNRPYTYEDLLEIAKGQIQLEDQESANSSDLLICDTDLIVIKIWSAHVFGKVDPWILQQIEEREYDYYLLMNIDLPWEPDPQREHPHLRDFFMDWYRNELAEYGKAFSEISGSEENRMKAAIKVIDKFLE